MRFYHVWFGTKWRQPIIEERLRREVLRWFKNVADEIDIRILAQDCIQDHAHLLVGLQDHHSLGIVMQRLKGRSAREIFLQFPDLRDEGSDASFWQKGYGFHYVAQDEIPTIRKYIENQEEHHGTM